MQTIDIDIGRVIPYENNPRYNENAVDAVARSIEEFGFQQPIVVDKDYVIIVGHTRHKAAKRLGLETVPCVVADHLTEEQVRAYRLADNKVGELAKWDFYKLDVEMEGIENIDMGDFGFDLGSVDIDWANVEEISEENYEKPASDKLRCPICGGIDEKIRFKKVNDTETSEEE